MHERAELERAELNWTSLEYRNKAVKLDSRAVYQPKKPRAGRFHVPAKTPLVDRVQEAADGRITDVFHETVQHEVVELLQTAY